MELEIASPNEEKKMQMARYQAQVAPLAPPEKGMGGQMLDMAKNRAMEGALNTGQEMVGSGVKPYMQKMINSINPAGSAGAGSVAGQAATNAALASTPATMGMGGAEIALAGQSLAPSLAAGAGGAGMATLATAVPYVGAGLLAGKVLGLFNEGGQVGPLAPQYAYDGTKARASGTGQYYQQGGQVGLNNTDEINRILDEIEAESMTEAAQAMPSIQKVMPLVGPLSIDPMDADTTYNPYNMMRPDNVPST